MKFEKCIIKKNYAIREYIKTYFYEEFASRLVIIIRKFFLPLYLNDMLKHSKFIKINRVRKINSNKTVNDKTSSNVQNEPSLHNTNKARQFKRKETFNLSPKKNIKPIPNKQRYSSLLNSNVSNQIRDKVNKKRIF